MTVVSSFLRNLSLIFLAIYRSLGAAWLGGACRFEPSCSDYAVQAFQKHSFFKALTLTTSRVCRCRPGGGFGYDPVEECHHGQ